MSYNHALIFAVLFILSAKAFAKTPAWFSTFHQTRNGQIIEVSCSGHGPDKTLANQASLNECNGISVQYVQGYSVKMKSISVETTRDTSWHSESSSNVVVKGLECEPQKQECSEENDSWTCYHVCRFNLSKAKLEANEKLDSPNLTSESESIVANSNDTNISPKVKKSNKPSFTQSGARNIVLSTVPKCDDVLIVGNPSRITKCSEIPVTLTINDGDHEAIVRLSGYRPNHLQINKRKPGSVSKPEEVTVYFEK